MRVHCTGRRSFKILYNGLKRDLGIVFPLSGLRRRVFFIFRSLNVHHRCFNQDPSTSISPHLRDSQPQYYASIKLSWPSLTHPWDIATFHSSNLYLPFLPPSFPKFYIIFCILPFLSVCSFGICVTTPFTVYLVD